MMGENNPYWGKEHSEEIREKISEGKRAHPTRRYGPAKGSFKQSPEARAKMSAAVKERWRTRRDFMLSNLPRGEDHHWKKKGHIKRHRSHFTKFQREEWISDKCFWCEASEGLELDHIIPISAGGKNVKENAQTLCRTCNVWKAHYVDRPFYIASLASQ